MPLPQSLRMTRQRRLILDELRRLKTHPTADEIFQVVKRRMPRISLATIYRNLDILSQAGVIQKLETAGLQRRFDGDISQHPHVRCVKCGRVDDMTGDARPPRIERMPRAEGYAIHGYRLEFLGTCPQCGKGGGNIQ
ncbi:MAG: transcriptional repressor [Candidatus Sumerlaeota bacterium]|nr:transcriptional repressor [Candidatus Sumerlaeota bacterium]